MLTLSPGRLPDIKQMFHIVLHQPQIPPNTGNIIRLCANTGAELHLIEPLGFAVDAASLRRAGLDYAWMARMHVHRSVADCLQALAGARLFAIETDGRQDYSNVRYRPGDVLLFGSEQHGLPADLLAELAPEQVLCIPMRSGKRSLNLSNSVAVVVYEAWRQNGFGS